MALFWRSLDHYRTLEKIVRDFYSADFSTLVDVWPLQMRILSLQRLIQDDLASVRKNRDEIERKKELASLEVVLSHSRRLADSIAWKSLGFRQGIVQSLSDRECRLHVPEDTLGYRGMFATARFLYDHGWGTPLIHDLTNVLRVGDITFVSETTVTTVEVKTLASQSDETQGIYTVDVQTTGADMIDALVESGPSSTSEFRLWIPSGRISWNQDFRPRNSRQVQRMNNASIDRTAPPNVPYVRQGAENVQAIVSHDYSDYEWPRLKRICAEAKRLGHYSEVVDGAFSYHATYGVFPEISCEEQADRAYSEFMNSAFVALPADDIGLLTIPEGAKEGREPIPNLPFFLYPLPQYLCIDLLWGKLTMIVAVNFSEIKRRLHARFEQAGISNEQVTIEDSVIQSFSHRACREFGEVSDVLDAIVTSVAAVLESRAD